jgi:hypothetical protein
MTFSASAGITVDDGQKPQHPLTVGADKRKTVAVVAAIPSEDLWLSSPTDLPQPSQKLPTAHTGSLFVPLPNGSVSFNFVLAQNMAGKY